jgi:hypothetical protein
MKKIDTKASLTGAFSILHKGAECDGIDSQTERLR